MQVTGHVAAPRVVVYRALLDADAIAQWRVPDGMRGEVLEFDPREGGAFRVFLTYDAPDSGGKTSGHTDTYHGLFAKLVPGEQVVEVVEFETDNPGLRGEIAHDHDADRRGQRHRRADPPRQHPGRRAGRGHEAGTRMALANLARLVESRRASG